MLAMTEGAASAQLAAPTRAAVTAYLLAWAASARLRSLMSLRKATNVTASPDLKAGEMASSTGNSCPSLCSAVTSSTLPSTTFPH